VTLPAGVSVTLFDSGLGLIGVFGVPASPLVSFAEGEFVYGGGVAVSRAVLDFDEASAPRFAFDNLTFGAAAVPEPSLFVLVAVGLAGIAAARRRLR
jgi:hypothetical protein